MVRPTRRVVGFGRAGGNVLPPTGDPPWDAVLVEVDVEVEAGRFAA